MSDDPGERHRRMQERHREGIALAKTLTGLSRTEAVDRVIAADLDPVVITPDVKVVTADLQFTRVRIFVDDDDVVRDAVAG